MIDNDTLSVTTDDGIATVTLERPDKMNALNAEVLQDLTHATEELAAEDDLQVVILKGEGRAFIAGADISAMLDMSPEEAEAFGQLGHDAMDAIASLRVPTIAAVDGFALGGGLEVALACDLIYASDRATFGLPEVSLGIIPGFGGTQRLGRRIGWQNARELIYTARRIGGDEAKSLGLVCDCFDADEFDAQIREVAEVIASRAPLAIRAAKEATLIGQESSLEDGLSAEREAFSKLFDSSDRREGMEAFVERRDPEFKGE